MITTHYIDEALLHARVAADHGLPVDTQFSDDVYQCRITYECHVGLIATWQDGSLQKEMEISPSKVRRAAKKILEYRWPDRVDSVSRSRQKYQVKVRPFWKASKARRQ